MTALRRSSRARRPVETIYDSASKKKEENNDEKKSKRKRSKSREPAEDEHENDDDGNESLASRSEDEEMIHGSSTDDDDGDDSADSDVEEEQLRSRKRKSTSAAAPKAARKTKSRAPPKAANRGVRGGRAPGRAQVQKTLIAMAKKVACEGETPENSLALALLLSCQSAKTKATNKKSSNNNPKETIYTAQLQKIAQALLEEHNSDANKAQVDLLNMIFRSVGGSFESFLDADEVDLEEVSDDDLGELIDDIVADMEDTNLDSTLLPIVPPKTKLVAVQEYSKIFQEFWYQLGSVALSGSVATSSKKKKDDDDSDMDGSDSEEDDDSSVKKSARFQVETVRDILSRLVEINQVGLSDCRAAVSTAIYSMTESVLEKTVELKKSLETAQRQLNVAKRSKSTRKAEALETQIASWKRTVADLESIAVDTTITSVFLRRYRDANPRIRAITVKALSRFTLIRPDLFLTSTYLKYFGWLVSDKDAEVREAAISALLAPFRAVAERKGKSHGGLAIDLEAMHGVLGKFLSRLADCVIDKDLRVQEVAIQLLLVLLRQHLLDDEEDDALWEQINMRSIAPDTTPFVRKEALYFVMDQLEVFDSGSSSSESDAVERLNALVDWIAVALSDSDIPQEAIRYDRTDLVIHSLRSMPEHKPLVCNWAAMLRVLQRDDKKRSGRKSIKKGDQRLDTVKQRVLLQMLKASAEMEVIDSSNEALEAITDPDLTAGRTAELKSLDTSTKQKKKASTHEELTLALLRALPDLLTSFKSETFVLQNLTAMPKYFLPSVLNLSSRKKDFHSLLANLSGIFLESTDQTILVNCYMAIVSLAKGGHSRSDEALLRLKEMAGTLRDRLLKLLEDKAKKADDDGSDDDEEDNEQEASGIDLERSINLCLRRLVILTKRWSLAELLAEAADDAIDDNELGIICGAVTKYIGYELDVRACTYPEGGTDEGEADIEIAKIWETADEDIHAIVADSVSYGLDFLLAVASWRLNEEIESGKKEYSDEEEIKHHLVIQVRTSLSKLIIRCYEHNVVLKLADGISEKHLEFAEAVLEHGFRAAGDLRCLFPKDWRKAASPFLRACALVDDSNLVGAGNRFIRSQEDRIRDNEDGSDEKLQAIKAFLFPVARGLCLNWETGNRREAGAVLAHIVGSGKKAHEVVQHFSRVLKKIEPVRLMEAHMACLRQDFEFWSEAYPEEPGDRPTDAEMAQFEEEEAAHKKRFEFIQNQARSLASSLGVAKLRDEKLAKALLGFVREGVRFAFSTNDLNSEEELPLGCRLPFLSILIKYLTFVRKDEGFKEVVKKELDEKESELRRHPEYGEVLEDDIEALAEFREIGELGEFVKDGETVISQLSGTQRTGTSLVGTTPGSRSRISEASSFHGLSTTQGSLDDGSLESIPEDPNENDDLDSSPSPKKRRKTPSSADKSEATMEVEQEEEGSVEEASPSPPKRRKTPSSADKSEATMDDDDEEASGEEGTPSPPKRRKMASSAAKSEATMDDGEEASDDESGDDFSAMMSKSP